jgi:hypothetical protein
MCVDMGGNCALLVVGNERQDALWSVRRKRDLEMLSDEMPDGGEGLFIMSPIGVDDHHALASY